MIHTLDVTHESVATLHTYHRNPRHGAVDAIRESLVVNGQYRPLIVNKGTHTGRPREVLAGNHTLMAARDEGWAEIQVCWLDVDNDQAARIVAADNRTSDLATYDDKILVELLQELTSVQGTGYSPADVDDLAAALEEQAATLPGLDDAVPRTAAGEGNSSSAPGRFEVDGLIDSRFQDEKAAAYPDRDVRSVYLTWSIAEFEWAVPRLEKLGETFAVETNAEIVLRLIADATGDEAP